MNIFDGLLGFEKLMLICGFILFVFALVAITVMIVQRRKFAMAMVLIVFAIVLMGFPGIQAVKFSQDTIELSRIRTQPSPVDPAQQQQAQQTLGNLEQRAAGNPRLQAKVADGYRAIGELDEAWRLAQSVLQQHPSAQVQATLVPVLTAKLNAVQADAAVAAPTAATGSTSATMAGTPAPAPAPVTSGAVNPPVAPPPVTPPITSPAAPAVTLDKQREIAAIASQLQHTDAALPAASHAALAKAYVVLGQPQKAQANVEAARRIDPNIKINRAVLRAARVGDHP